MLRIVFARKTIGNAIIIILDDGVCVNEDGPVDPVYPPLDCPAGTQYYKTKGYRKEAGNTCDGGVDHSADGPYPCSKPSSAKRGWIAAAVLVPLVVIVLIAAAVAVQSEKVREKLPFLKVLSTWKVGYSGMNQEEGGNNNTMLMDDEEERDREDFSIQAEEIEEQQLEKLDDKSKPTKKNDSLIHMEDDKDDFNPRR